MVISTFVALNKFALGMNFGKTHDETNLMLSQMHKTDLGCEQCKPHISFISRYEWKNIRVMRFDA